MPIYIDEKDGNIYLPYEGLRPSKGPTYLVVTT